MPDILLQLRPAFKMGLFSNIYTAASALSASNRKYLLTVRKHPLGARLPGAPAHPLPQPDLPGTDLYTQDRSGTPSWQLYFPIVTSCSFLSAL
jgi:hypothetical protein